jgi:hypothetical protein
MNEKMAPAIVTLILAIFLAACLPGANSQNPATLPEPAPITVTTAATLASTVTNTPLPTSTPLPSPTWMPEKPAGTHTPPELIYISRNNQVMAQEYEGSARILAELPDTGRVLDALTTHGRIYVLTERAVLEINLDGTANRILADLDPPVLSGSLMVYGETHLLYSVNVNGWDQAGIGTVDLVNDEHRYIPESTGYIAPLGFEPQDDQLIGVPLSGDPEYPEFVHVNLETGELTRGLPTSNPPMTAFGYEWAAMTRDGRFLAFSTKQYIAIHQPFVFGLSLYDFSAEPPALQSFALPQAPSHIFGNMLAAPDQHSFYFLLRAGSYHDEPATSYGLWRFDALTGSFAMVADWGNPTSHLAWVTPQGDWLLLVSEANEPVMVHAPSGQAYPYNLDHKQIAQFVRP